MEFKKVSVIGLGYIGLPTAVIFANNNIDVTGVDIDRDVRKKINSGKAHIFEPGLDKLLEGAVKKGKLLALRKPVEADAFIITVPTPFLEESDRGIKVPDLTYVNKAVDTISEVLKKGDLIILESTSPVGTTNSITERLLKLRPDLSLPIGDSVSPDINIAYCPERVIPGNILDELVNNDRVIGGMTSACSKKASALYKKFLKANCFITDAKTAEMVKLTENSSRDAQIAFANELSMICDELNIDVWELISLANRHPRVNILEPGPGVGGHCIAVDPWFIAHKSPGMSRLIQEARHVNDSKPDWVISKVLFEVDKLCKSMNEEDIVITCLGLTFKADIDDIRESPALKIFNELERKHTGNVFAVEPNISKDDMGFNLISIDKALKVSNIIVALVDHKQFKKIKFKNSTVIIDCKGIYGEYK